MTVTPLFTSFLLHSAASLPTMFTLPSPQFTPANLTHLRLTCLLPPHLTSLNLKSATLYRGGKILIKHNLKKPAKKKVVFVARFDPCQPVTSLHMSVDFKHLGKRFTRNSQEFSYHPGEDCSGGELPSSSPSLLPYLPPPPPTHASNLKSSSTSILWVRIVFGIIGAVVVVNVVVVIVLTWWRRRVMEREGVREDSWNTTVFDMEARIKSDKIRRAWTGRSEMNLLDLFSRASKGSLSVSP